MAKNIFSQMKAYVQKPKRNTFDLSFQNNLTMQLGYLYPVFCKEVIPGDSFRITPTFGLRFMPLNFPIQTRIQANLHFFYVRNRNLWKDWPDFIGRTKDNLELPYIACRAKYVDNEWKLPVDYKILHTGAIGDFLGLPTTLIGDYGSESHVSYEDMLRSAGDQQFANWSWQTQYADGGTALGAALADVAGESLMPGFLYGIKTPKIQGFFSGKFTALMTGYGTPLVASVNWWNAMVCILDDEGICKVAIPMRPDYVSMKSDDDNGQTYDFDLTKAWSNMWSFFAFDGDNKYTSVQATKDAGFETFNDVLEKVVGSNYQIVMYNTRGYESYETDSFPFNINILNLPNQGASSSCRTFSGLVAHSMSVPYREVYESPQVMNPYRAEDIRVSALPFRAYESIYNAFYRNQQNDPFKIDGTPEYNKYLPSYDDTTYTRSSQDHLQHWEDTCYTLEYHQS